MKAPSKELVEAFTPIIESYDVDPDNYKKRSIYIGLFCLLGTAILFANIFLIKLGVIQSEPAQLLTAFIAVLSLMLIILCIVMELFLLLQYYVGKVGNKWIKYYQNTPNI